MARDISIAYSARDQISPAINSMRNSNKLFNKDLEETQHQIDTLNKRQDSLTEGLGKSRKKLDETASALKQAKKDYEEYGQVLGKDYLSKFYQDHEEAKQQVKDFEAAIKSTRKEVNGLSDDMNRAGNRAGGFGGTEQSMMSSLAKAGLGKMLGDSVSNTANVMIGSAFGDAMGSAISTTLSGTLTGAAIGSIIPGVGTAIGAAVGTAAGAINAYSQNYQKEDDAFKAAVQEQVEAQWQRQAEDLTAGSTLASTREGYQRRLGSLGAQSPGMLDGTLYEIGRTPPFSYDTAMELASSMMGLGMSEAETIEKINSLADAAAALNLSDSGVNTIVTQLETAQMTGKVDTRVMRSLMRMGINPYEALAEMFTVDGNTITPDQVAEYLPDLDADIFVDAMYKYFGSRFAGAAEGMSNTYAGISGIAQSYQDEMNSAMGEGYNKMRTQGLQTQVEYLSGESGERMKEANRLIGEWKASLENDREALIRQYESDALEQIERDGLTGAEAGKVLAESRIKAEAAYLESDGARLEVESQKALVDSVRGTLKEDEVYKKFGYEMGQEFTKGLASVQGDIVNALTPNANAVQGRSRTSSGTEPYSSNPRSPHYPGNAWGIPYVPYDNYITRLHEGEEVLTASEARSRDRGTGAPIINVYDPVVREEQDFYRLAQVFATELGKASKIG